MATPTESVPILPMTTTAEPTGTAYIWSAPVTDRDKLLCMIFGFGLIGIMIVATISAVIYGFVYKPRKMKAAQRAAAVNGDAEGQNRNVGPCRSPMWDPSSYKSNAQWASDSTIDIESPPLTAMPPGRERSKKQKRPRIHNPESFR